ncbi:MAG: hypothetical protein IKC59_00625 [Clostridia bacterium]|nr:hypothetical protein [Clostridia bacterium]
MTTFNWRHKAILCVYSALLFLGACAIVIFNWEIYGAILFGYIAALTLLISPRLTDAMLPAMLLAVFVTRCYKSADIFFSKLPLILPIVLLIILHFIIHRKQYRARFHLGRSFVGLCGVSIAVTLGGIGTIPAADYFSGTSLFYIFGLGVGMLLFYVIVKSNFDEDSPKDVARILYIAGLLACFCVLNFYVEAWDVVRVEKHTIVFQSSNNLATFLMLAMPFPIYYAAKHKIHLLSVILIYGCLLLTDSRGGVLMGTIEFFLLLIVAACQKKNPVGVRILSGGMLIASVFLMCRFAPQIGAFLGIIPAGDLPTAAEYRAGLEVYLKDNARSKLLVRMVEDLKSNPWFGVGIGYRGNVDLYNPAKGAMTWYHLWVAQVVGGLGTVGIIAYGYQLIERIMLYFRNRTLINLTFFLSYLGLFLMSQVNPGEFCPMPYAALAMTYFALIEEKPPKLPDPSVEQSLIRKMMSKFLR